MGHETENRHRPGAALLRAIAVTLTSVICVIWITTPAPLAEIDIADGTLLLTPDFRGNTRLGSVDSALINRCVPASTYAHWSKWLVLFHNVTVTEANDEVTFSHAELQFINGRSGQVAGSIEIKDRFGTCGFLPDGRFVALTSPLTNQGTLRAYFFDPGTGKSQTSDLPLWDRQTNLRHRAADVRISNNRSTLAIRTYNGDLELIDIANMVRTTVRPGPMRSTTKWALSPDGSMVAICGEAWHRWKKFGHGIEILSTSTGRTLKKISDIGAAPPYRQFGSPATFADTVSRAFDADMTDYWGKTESQAWGVNTLGFDKSGTRLWWSTSRAVGTRRGFSPHFETPDAGIAPTGMVNLISDQNEAFNGINRNIPEIHWYTEDDIHAESMDRQFMLIREDRDSDGIYAGKNSRNYRVTTRDKTRLAGWPDGTRPQGGLFAKEQFVPESTKAVFVHRHAESNPFIHKYVNPLLSTLSLPFFPTETVTQTTCYDWMKQHYTTVCQHPRRSVRTPYVCQPGRVALTIHQQDLSRLEIWQVPANNFQRSWTLALAIPFAVLMYCYFRCPIARSTSEQ